MRPRARPQPEPASDEELVEFLRWVADHREEVNAWPRFDDPTFRSAVPAEFRKNVGGLARRILMDVLKRPTPKGLTPSEPPRRKATARKPAPDRRRGRSPKKKTR